VSLASDTRAPTTTTTTTTTVIPAPGRFFVVVVNVAGVRAWTYLGVEAA
jgi:hypothetical protein